MKQKLTKEEKQELRQEKKAWSELIRRAVKKGALVQNMFIMPFVFAILMICACGCKEGRITQEVRENPCSGSCGYFCTYVWYDDEIARVWYDNTCGITDSIIKTRKKEAQYLLSVLRNSK